MTVARTPQRAARPTPDGLAVLALTAAIGAVALASGNNLLYLLWAVALVLWAAELALGRANLADLSPLRQLPAELVADSDATGRLVIRNHRRWLPAIALEVEDVGAGASVAIAEVVPRGAAGGVAVWRFPDRGPAALRSLRVRSRFPFGWVDRELDVPAPAEIVVYPRSSAASILPDAGSDGAGRDAAGARGGVGEFHGLRGYEAGDRLRSIHWRTTARVGAVMVIQRSAEADPAVCVRVRRTPPEAWEAEISRAAGELSRAFARGWRVGLELPAVGGGPARSLPEQGGSTWRRALLEALALLPEAP